MKTSYIYAPHGDDGDSPLDAAAKAGIKGYNLLDLSRPPPALPGIRQR